MIQDYKKATQFETQKHSLIPQGKYAKVVDKEWNNHHSFPYRRVNMRIRVVIAAVPQAGKENADERKEFTSKAFRKKNLTSQL